MTHAASIVLVRTNLGLVPGVEELGAALLACGLADGIGATVGAAIDAPPYTGERPDPRQPMHTLQIAGVARRQADVVADVLAAGRFPLVLGGDDSILFGNLLALRRRGRYGLVFVDAHLDVWPPEQVASGQASDSDLYMALGYGPAEIANLDGLGPLVRADDVVAIGQRDPEDDGEHLAWLRGTGATVIPLVELRAEGVVAATAAALGLMERQPIDGFFVHLDADALHDDLMPAVEWRLPDGLTGDEYTALVATVLAHPRCVGADVSIYNPRLDPDRTAAHTLARALVDAWPTAR